VKVFVGVRAIFPPRSFSSIDQRINPLMRTIMTSNAIVNVFFS
jgi:hypothetical protein